MLDGYCIEYGGVGPQSRDEATVAFLDAIHKDWPCAVVTSSDFSYHAPSLVAAIDLRWDTEFFVFRDQATYESYEDNGLLPENERGIINVEYGPEGIEVYVIRKDWEQFTVASAALAAVTAARQP